MSGVGLSEEELDGLLLVAVESPERAIRKALDLQCERIAAALRALNENSGHSYCVSKSSVTELADRLSREGK